MEYYSIKWITPQIARRKTKEVDITCTLLDEGKRMILEGTGDLEHHLVEDSAILLRKMCEVKCGSEHKI